MRIIHAAKACWQMSFPEPGEALPGGLLAVGGDLEAETLISAYRQGIFPWYSAGDPIMWWSPAPRCALFLNDFHVSKRSARAIRNAGFDVSFDQAFDSVISACAAAYKGRVSTWITPEMQAAYIRLATLGYAHSVEIWQNDRLVGGLYGIALGRIFFGESMFHLVNESSRAALMCLAHKLKKANFRLIDCQQASPHMLKMGAVELERSDFQALLEEASPGPSFWPLGLRVPVREFLSQTSPRS